MREAKKRISGSRQDTFRLFHPWELGSRPGANGVVELSPLEFLDRLADLVPLTCPTVRHRKLS
jgi:hypothetical protein